MMQRTPVMSPVPERFSRRAVKMVAGVLLEQAAGVRLSRRDIAAMTGIDRVTVHRSLGFLQIAGAIRMEGHRLIINKELLHRAAAA